MKTINALSALLSALLSDALSGIRALRMKMPAQNIPDEAYLAYADQTRNATAPFLLSFPEWWAWWQTDNRWSRRGKKHGCFKMGRIDTQGPFSLDNIVCVEIAAEPSKARPKDNVNAERRARLLSVRSQGSKHIPSRVVVTPDGHFPSAAEASRHYGITPQAASRRCRVHTQGWHYENETP